MARGIQHHERFLRTLISQLRWLEEHRPQQYRDDLQAALAAFEQRVAEFPELADEVNLRGTASYRVRLIDQRLPYIIYYSFDKADPDGDVNLLLLLHEKQDRARFDPSDFDDD